MDGASRGWFPKLIASRPSLEFCVFIMGWLIARDHAAAVYESVTGKKASRPLDIGMSIDTRHKDEPYYAYVTGEKDGNIAYASPVYSGDRLRIENFWGKGFVYDLTDKIASLYSKEDGMDDLKISLKNIEAKENNAAKKN